MNGVTSPFVVTVQNRGQDDGLFVIVRLRETDVVDNGILQLLSKEICDERFFLGKDLELSDSEIETIQKDFPGSRLAAYKILVKWKQRKGDSATFQKVTYALENNDRTDLSNRVQEYRAASYHKRQGFIDALKLAESLGRQDALTVAEHYHLYRSDRVQIWQSHNPGATLIQILLREEKVTITNFCGLKDVMMTLKTENTKEIWQNIVSNHHSSAGKDNEVLRDYLKLAESWNRDEASMLSDGFDLGRKPKEAVQQSMNPGVSLLIAVLEKGLKASVGFAGQESNAETPTYTQRTAPGYH